MKILITGKTSRFVTYLKKELQKYNTYYPNKKIFNILNFKQINNYLRSKKVTHLIHIAGLSRPMNMHETDIENSISLNIIGTANIARACFRNKVKLIYFSTNYVYQGNRGNYKESDQLLPINNYAWSKLGGEASVHMYKNSLILRLSMTDYPFVHKKAISGAYSSFIFNKEVAKIIPRLLSEKGIINIGGKCREIYKFAKLFANQNIKKIPYLKIRNFPKNSSVNISKLCKILKKKK